MQPQSVDLSGLKDIHLPPIPSAWPPDSSVWETAAVMLIAVVLLWLLIRFLRRATPNKYVLKELARLDTAQISPDKRASDILKLIRRAALARYGRVGVADLSGKSWFDFLTERGAVFSPQAAEIVEYGAYLPPERITKEAVADLSESVRNWVVKL